MDIPSSIERIDQLRPVQQRIWTISRISWGGMIAVLLLAAGGVFGDGPLAKKEESSGDGSLHVTYERFQRADAAAELLLQVSRRNPMEEPAFCLDRAFLETWRLSRTEPAPVRSERRGDDLCQVLARGDDATTILPVHLWVHPYHFSLSAEGRIYVPDGHPVAVEALVWP